MGSLVTRRKLHTARKTQTLDDQRAVDDNSKERGGDEVTALVRNPSPPLECRMMILADAEHTTDAFLRIGPRAAHHT